MYIKKIQFKCAMTNFDIFVGNKVKNVLWYNYPDIKIKQINYHPLTWEMSLCSGCRFGAGSNFSFETAWARSSSDHWLLTSSCSRAWPCLIFRPRGGVQSRKEGGRRGGYDCSMEPQEECCVAEKYALHEICTHSKSDLKDSIVN